MRLAALVIIRQMTSTRGNLKCSTNASRLAATAGSRRSSMRFTPASMRRLRLVLARIEGAIGFLERGRPRRDSPGRKGCSDAGAGFFDFLTFALSGLAPTGAGVRISPSGCEKKSVSNDSCCLIIFAISGLQWKYMKPDSIIFGSLSGVFTHATSAVAE
jgi:hypothetical protein